MPDPDIAAIRINATEVHELCDALNRARNDIRILDDALDTARIENADWVVTAGNLSVRAEAAEARIVELEEDNADLQVLFERMDQPVMQTISLAHVQEWCDTKDRLELAEQRIDAGLALHEPGDFGFEYEVCTGCGNRYPCLTVKALDGVA